MPRLKPWFQFFNSYLKSIKHFSSQQTHLYNVGPIASLLKSRAIVRFRGPDTVKFLQGLLTNDVRRLVEPPREEEERKPSLVTPNVPFVSPSPMYAAMLTPQGRFLYDFFLYSPPRPDEKLNRTGTGPGSPPDEMVVFADVDRTVIDEVLETLKKYRLRSKVGIENVDGEYSCWQRFGGNLRKDSSEEDPEAASSGWGGAIEQAGVSASRGNDVGWQWHRDPRLCCLGFRGIFPSNTTPPLVEADREAGDENYLLWRIEVGVAEGSTEIPKGEAIPLEYNLEGLNAISFDKGCYVGQELIARTHHRGVIRKRLLPLKFVNNSGKEAVPKVVPGSEIVLSGSGKKAGTINTAIGPHGLGLLRLEDAFKGSLAVKGQEDVTAEPLRPAWWPPEWFLE